MVIVFSQNVEAAKGELTTNDLLITITGPNEPYLFNWTATISP